MNNIKAWFMTILTIVVVILGSYSIGRTIKMLGQAVDSYITEKIELIKK